MNKLSSTTALTIIIIQIIIHADSKIFRKKKEISEITKHSTV